MRIIFNVLKVGLLLILLINQFTPLNLISQNFINKDYLVIGSNFLIFILVVDLAIRISVHFYRRKKNLKRGKNDNVTLGLTNIYYLFLTGAVIGAGLALFGVDFRTFFTSISIVAAAIAIISKDYIVDIISGIILSFSSYIKIDDYVKIGEEKGKIVDMTLTKTLLLSEDDDVIAVPNNMVYSTQITNYTRKASKKVSIEFKINLESLSTIERLEDALIASLSEFEDYIEEQTYYLRVEAVDKDSLALKFQFVLKRMNRSIEKDIKTKTVRRVINFVKSNMSNSDNSVS
ncbi:mechanosensitive ion channel family protein [Membranihabitans maritimus]|uniref:mechanosensitive ion channel family protein n=1 Tax=Membranihabitans maritimus TaxID=2904244 RepID=UPI001F1BB905|nr:mechanosensitive ion channel domain-containing protein [Membranihabitans maritimus]